MDTAPMDPVTCPSCPKPLSVDLHSDAPAAAHTPKAKVPSIIHRLERLEDFRSSTKIEALVEELEGQSREAGADETVQRQLMRRVGQATAAIKMKELRGGAIGGTGGGGGRGSPPRASKRQRGE